MATRRDQTFQIGPRSIRVVDASITALDERVDALVSSDDNHLTHGGGVSKALWEAAGPGLVAHVAASRPSLRLGDVWPTPAFNLHAPFLLHAVTIDFDANRVVAPAGAGRLFRAVLISAEREGCCSIALPLLGTGAGALDPDDGIAALEHALAVWLALPSALNRVILAAPGRPWARLKAAVKRLHTRTVSIDALIAVVSSGSPGAAAPGLVRAWQILEQTAIDRRGPALGALFDATLGVCATSWWRAAAAERRAGSVAEAAIGREPALLATEADGRKDDARIAEWPSGLGAPDVLEVCLAGARVLGQRVPLEVEGGVRAALLVRHQLAGDASGAQSESFDTVALAFRDVLALALAGIGGDQAEAGEAITTGISPSFDHALSVGRLLSASIGDDGVRHAANAVPVPYEAEEPAPAPAQSGLFMLRPPPVPREEPGRRAEQFRLGFPDIARSRAERTAGAGAFASGTGGTEHVRRLHKFLLEYLPAEVQRQIDERLKQQDYHGTADMRLLEHCIRVAEPVAFVASEFSRAQLAEAMRRKGWRVDASRSVQDLACDLLAKLGFPRHADLRGLSAASKAVRSCRATLLIGDRASIRGVVTEVAAHLEHVSHILLRFVCQAVYGRPPEQVFPDWNERSPGLPLAQAGLGTLFHLLQELGERLEHDDSAAPALLRLDFRGRRLFPAGAAGLPRIRNSFAHDRQSDSEGQGEHVLRDRAQEFFRAADDLLEYLAEPTRRVFPHLVQIEGIEFDRWARRVVRAIDEDGGSELLFTDVPLEPGQVYFMHPLTNPMWVDPILLPAGDLVWPEGKG